MALVDVEGSGSARTPYYLAKPAPIPAPAPYLPYPDEQYTYSTYSPEAIAEQWPSAAVMPGRPVTAAGPQGGVVNYAVDADPNGYRWVDDGTPGGYWYRPSDGAVWRNTPLERAKQAAISAANSGFGQGSVIPQPVTNAPVVRGIEPNTGWPVPGQPAPTVSQAFTPTYASTPENMGAFDLAYSNAAAYNQSIPQSPLYSDADMAALDLGFSNATSAVDREQQRIIAGLNPDYSNVDDINAQLQAFQGYDIGAGALPQGRIPQPVGPSPFALPEQRAPGHERIWVPGNPDSPIPRAQEGHWEFAEKMPSSGYSDWGFVNDLTTTILPPSIQKYTTDYLPTPLESAAEFATSPAGLLIGAFGAPTLGLGVAGTMASNAAIDVAFGLAQAGAEKAGVPKPYTQLLGLAAAAGVGGGLEIAAKQAGKSAARTAARGADDLLREQALRPSNFSSGAPGASQVWDSTRNAWVPRTPSPVVQGAKAVPGTLTKEAEELLARVRAGGVPAYVTPNLERIAKENGVNVTGSMTPNDVIAAIRAKGASGARPPAAGIAHVWNGEAGGWTPKAVTAAEAAKLRADDLVVPGAIPVGQKHVYDANTGMWVPKAAPKAAAPLRDTPMAAGAIPKDDVIPPPGSLDGGDLAEGLAEMRRRAPEIQHAPPAVISDRQLASIADFEQALKKMGNTSLGLTPAENVWNSTFGHVFKKAHEFASPAMRNYRREIKKMDSVAGAMSMDSRARLRTVFKINDKTNIVEGIDFAAPGLPLRPTVADLFENYHAYKGQLSPAQREVIEIIGERNRSVENYLLTTTKLLDEAIPAEKGYYFPRGNVIKQANPEYIPGRLSLKPGSLKAREFLTQADGMKAGLEYENWSTSMDSTYSRLGKALALDRLKQRVLSLPTLTTVADRMDPNVLGKWKDLQKTKIQVRATVRTMEAASGRVSAQQDELDRLIDAVVQARNMDEQKIWERVLKVGQVFDEKKALLANQQIRAIRNTLDAVIKPATGARQFAVAAASDEAIDSVARKIYQSMLAMDDMEFMNSALTRTWRRAEKLQASATIKKESVVGVKKRLENLEAEIEAFKPKYEKARERAWAVDASGEYGIISDIPGLQGTQFPAELAGRIQKDLRRMSMPPSETAQVFKVLNGMWRFLMLSLDASVFGTTLAVGLVANPVVFGRSMAVFTRALFSDEFMPTYIKALNDKAVARGLPSVHEMAAGGLEISGDTLGWAIDDASKVGHAWTNLPLFKQANRAFGAAADAYSINYAQWAIENRSVFDPAQYARIFKGNKDDMFGSIYKVANALSGKGQFATEGSVGEVRRWLELAPRFTSAHLELMAMAMAKGGPQGAQARKAMGSFIGLALFGTAAINHFQGRDWREWAQPYKDGRYNNNFMTFRMFDRDNSLLGPFQTYTRGLLSLGHGIMNQNWEEAAYLPLAKGSPWVKLGWDLWRQSDFYGRSPSDAMFWVDRFLPIPFQTRKIGEFLDPFQAESLGEFGKEAWQVAVDLGGYRSSPLTKWEQYDEDLKQYHKELMQGGDGNYLYDTSKPVDYWNLTDKGKAWLAERGLTQPQQSGDYQTLQELIKGAEDERLRREREALRDFKAGLIDGETYRKNLSTIKSDFYTQIEDAYGDVYGPLNPATKNEDNPFRRAEQEYYALNADEKLTYTGGVFDPAKWADEYAKLQETWTPAQRKYIEEQVRSQREKELDKRRDPEAKRAEDIWSELEKLGYTEADGKVEFLINHENGPAAEAILKEFNLDDAKLTGLADEYRTFQKQQAARDEALANGTITPDKWREDTDASVDALRAASRVAYKELEGKAREGQTEEDKLVEQFYLWRTEAALVYGENIPWEAQEAYLAKNPDVKAALDAQPDPWYATRFMNERAVVREALDASGYFDLQDSTWSIFARDKGINQDYDTWFVENGGTWVAGVRTFPNEAAKDINQEYLNLLYGYKGSTKVAPVEGAIPAWQKQNPQLAKDAQAFGYTTIKDETRVAMGEDVPGYKPTTYGTGGSSSSGTGGSGSSTPKGPTKAEQAAADKAAERAAIIERENQRRGR